MADSDFDFPGFLAGVEFVERGPIVLSRYGFKKTMVEGKTYLEAMSKEGEAGRKRIAKITRHLTIVIAFFSAIGITLGFRATGHVDAVRLLCLPGRNSSDNTRALQPGWSVPR